MKHFQSHNELDISCCLITQDWNFGELWAKETWFCKSHRLEDLRANDEEGQRAKKFSWNFHSLVEKNRDIITKKKWIIRKVEGKRESFRKDKVISVMKWWSNTLIFFSPSNDYLTAYRILTWIFLLILKKLFPLPLLLFLLLRSLESFQRNDHSFVSNWSFFTNRF